MYTGRALFIVITSKPRNHQLKTNVESQNVLNLASVEKLMDLVVEKFLQSFISSFVYATKLAHQSCSDSHHLISSMS